MPIRVGLLPEAVARTVGVTVRDVYLTHVVYRHILERRLRDEDAQVALVLKRLTEVVEAPSYMSRRTDHWQKFELYGRYAGDPAGICVGIKCLEGETWVSTAFPVGHRSLQKYLRHGRLIPI